MFSKDAASPQNNITTRRLIKQIQTNPSLMFSAAYEKKKAAAVGLRDSRNTSSGQDAYRGPGAGHKAAGQRAGGRPPATPDSSCSKERLDSAHISSSPGPMESQLNLPGSSPKPSRRQERAGGREAMLLGLQLMAI